MRLSKTADFYIRILAHLSKQKIKTTNAFLSKNLQIPYAYLVSLVRDLGRKHYIKTSKGKGGGVRLLKDSRQISLLEIVELAEGPVLLSDCFIDPNYCKLDKGCGLRKKIGKLQNDIVKMLKNTYISDVI